MYILSYCTSHRRSVVSVGHPTCNDVSINHYSNQHSLFGYLLWRVLPVCVCVCYILLVIHRGLSHNSRVQPILNVQPRRGSTAQRLRAPAETCYSFFHTLTLPSLRAQTFTLVSKCTIFRWQYLIY